MKLPLLVLLPLTLLTVAACSSDDDKLDVTTDYDGIWTSAAYGTTFRIDGETVEVFEHTSDYCLRSESFDEVSADDMRALFVLSADAQSMTDPGLYGTRDFHAPTQTYQRQADLPAVCLTPLTTQGEAGYTPQPELDFAVFAQTFDEYYLSFDLKGVDWAQTQTTAALQVGPGTSDDALFEVLFDMIAPLRDSHVSISADAFGEASVDGKPTMIEQLLREYADDHQLALPIPEAHVDAAIDYIGAQLALMEAITLGYAGDSAAIHQAANGMLVWYSVGEVSYLQIRAMGGFSDDPEDNAAELAALEAGLDEVMNDIRDQQALIVDLRLNNGGSDFLSLAIASRFVGSAQQVYSKQARDGASRTSLTAVTLAPRGEVQFLKPVVVLTSASTVSAAETFTLAMRSLPQVTLIGEATQGALSDMLERTLPNGFRFTLSNEFYLSNEGEWFEDSGIPVEIEVPYFSREQREEGIDAGLEVAYEYLASEG